MCQNIIEFAQIVERHLEMIIESEKRGDGSTISKLDDIIELHWRNFSIFAGVAKGFLYFIEHFILLSLRQAKIVLTFSIHFEECAKIN